MPPTPERDHLYYGLRLRTPLPLPALPELTGDGQPDLTLRRGAVPDSLPGALWASPFVEIGADGAVLIRIPGVVSFLVRDGCELTLDEATTAPVSEIETFLFSAVAGAVLHQRAILPLHASCIMVGDRAVAMAGVSGRGKSTLAGIMARRGHAVVSDDICPVSFSDTAVFITPGPARLRLWPDAAQRLGLATEGLETGRPGHPKRVLPAPASAAAPRPLAALIRLGIDKRLSAPVLHRLTGPAAITPIEELVYRARLGRRLDRRVGLFRDLARLAGMVPVYQLIRPEETDPDHLADLVITAAGGGDDA